MKNIHNFYYLTYRDGYLQNCNAVLLAIIIESRILATKYFVMKIILVAFFILFCSQCVVAQHVAAIDKPDTTKKIQIVEASCGECQFKMEGKGCELAVRIKGKSYFVDGTSIDDHGDAHGKEGFCEAIRKAAVQGEIVNNRFKATYFKLITPVKER